ncbi:MAG: hypothetical protein LZF61_00330 [Nitrosomonas sp.]|nr:MAG: hypothetical protein LZF61_00330 [Nitrosomonas sp.]
MKAVSKSSWITRFGGMLLATCLTSSAYAQLMLAHEGHHSGGDCSIKTGDFHVSFSAYEIPEGGIPPLHAFCTSIPNTGKVSLTIEIPPPARELSLAVRLIKDDHTGHSGHAVPAEPKAAATDKHEGHDDHEEMNHDDHAGHGKVEHGLVYMPPAKHSSGIIVIAANIQEKGHYAVQLERHDNSGVKTVVKVPLSIGMGGGHGSHGGGLGMMEIVLLVVAAGGGAAFYFMRRKKAA